jgi:hypothetical protein
MEENAKSRGEDQRLLVKTPKPGAIDWDLVRSINEEYMLWIGEQMHAADASKWGGPLEAAAMSKVAMGAYGEAAKKNLDKYVALLMWTMHLSKGMEERREAILKGSSPDVSISEYLEAALPRIRDSLEFGLLPEEKETLTKLHREQLAKAKEEAFTAIAGDCAEVVSRQTFRAKELLEVGMPPMEMMKEVAREAYFDGAYEGAEEVKRLKTSAENLLEDLEAKKTALKSGASPDAAASKYIEEFIPRMQECMKSNGIKKCETPNKVT